MNHSMMLKAAPGKSPLRPKAGMSHNLGQRLEAWIGSPRHLSSFTRRSTSLDCAPRRPDSRCPAQLSQFSHYSRRLFAYLAMSQPLRPVAEAEGGFDTPALPGLDEPALA